MLSPTVLQQVDAPGIVIPTPITQHITANVNLLVTGRYMQNTLYFTTDAGFSIDPTLIAIDLGGAMQLDLLPQWGAILSNIAHIVGVDIMIHNPSWDNLLAQPYPWTLDIAGGLAWSLSGRAQTYNFNFKLDLSQGVTPIGLNSPKKTRIHVGPGSEFAIDNAGDIVNSVFPTGAINDFMNHLVNPLTGSHYSFYPIRKGVPVPNTVNSAWCPVNGVYLRARSSFRRSRNR